MSRFITGAATGVLCTSLFFLATNVQQVRADKVRTECVDATKMYESGFSDGQANVQWGWQR